MWGSVYQIITVLLGFVGRTVFIRCLGAQYLGIAGLFTNIPTIFSLTELGFSTAVSFHLYRQLSTDNWKEISGIMNFYKWVYRVVAMIILVLGCVMTPFLKYIIKESPFDIKYITVIYLIYLFKTVSTYLFSYNFTLATADQKHYLLTKLDIILHIVVSSVNIFTLVVFRNYIIYLVTEILIGILGNYIKTLRVKKAYPYLDSKEVLSKESKKKIWGDVKNIFAGKVSTVIVTSTDNILISSIINVTAVGLYSNYSMIISYITTFLTQFTSATQASLGNMLAQESKEYSYTVLKRLTTVLYFVTSFCTVSLVVLLNPFITAWLGEKYLLNFSIVIICVVNFYIQIMKTPLWFSVGGLGYFKEDRNISIYGAVSNLLVSIIAANICGLFGIFFGTAFSQITQWILKARLYCKKYLNTKATEYAILLLKLSILTAVFSAVTWGLSCLVVVPNMYVALLLKGCICLIVPNVLNYLLFRKSDEFRYLTKTLMSIVTKKRGTAK